MIYLDNAATTYPKPECVYEAMEYANRHLAFNAGRGSYKEAREASSIISETRQLLLDLVHGNGAEKVVLTTSATEALNIILQGISWEEGDYVYISPYEHNAVARVLNLISKQKKVHVELLPLKEETLEIDVDKLQFLFLKTKPKCVCCTHVSNVTGYVLPVQEIFNYAHQVGAITVMDGSQSVGLIDFNLNEIDADFVVFAGHKTLYGPFGVGGFIDVKEIPLETVYAGGTGSDSLNLAMPNVSPDRYEAASKNIVAISGLRASLLKHNIRNVYSTEMEMMQMLISLLKKVPGIIIYYSDSTVNNHVGVLSFNVKGYTADELGSILSDDFGIAVRTGYHCAPYIHNYLKDNSFKGTVRVGLSQFTSREDIKLLYEALLEIGEG